jgi:sugar lactone lactonase YvrE
MAGSALTGRVKGGQNPISNATIALYAAGSGGPGAGAVKLTPQTPQLTTDSQGNFSITGDYTCPSGTAQVYLVAQGGNPGLPGSINNSAILLMAALGDCGALSTPGYFIDVDEVTTAAAAWALAPFLAPGGVVGASSTNATGLQNAFLNASKLVNTATGTAPGAALPAGVTIEAAKLNTLANALSGCVNSDGTTACNALFQAATVGSSVPSNTLDAARNVVLNPAYINATNMTNVQTAVFNAVPAQPPFSPGLTTAPHDWTMSITYTGGGLNDPSGVAVDSQGDVWVANFLGGAVTEISRSGQLRSLSAQVCGVVNGNGGGACPESNLEESFGVAVDGSDNVWVTNEQSASSVNSGDGSIIEFNSAGQVVTGAPYTAGGLYFPYAIAAVKDGSVWVAEYGSSTATHLAAGGSPLSGPEGYTDNHMQPLYPNSVAIDASASQNAWFGASSEATEVTPSGTISSYYCCGAATDIAIDRAGDVWLTDRLGGLVEMVSNPTVCQSVAWCIGQTLTATGGSPVGPGGIYDPANLAIDGNGNVWLTNFSSAVAGQNISTISAVNGANSGPNSFTAISPANGFGLDAGMEHPDGIAIDASGSIWVSDWGGSAITQFVGLAAPIATPLLGPPQQP